MRKWIISLVVAAIVTAIAYMVRLELFGEKSITAHYTLSLSNENVNPVASILSSRLKAADFSFNDPVLSGNKSYELQFDVELQQAKDTQLLNILLGSKGSLQFWETYDFAEQSSLSSAIKEAIDSIYGKEKDKKENTKDSGLVALMQQPDPEFSTATYNKLFGNIYNYFTIALKDSAEVGIIMRHPLVKAALPADAFFCYGSAYNGHFEELQPYLIRTRGREKPFLENSHIKSASLDFDAINGNPIVSVQFTNQGAITWEQFTENNVHKVIAMTMDSFVLSAPQVSEKITGGKTVLSGNFSADQANAMASLISITPLPSPVQITGSEVKSKKTVTLSTRRLLVLGLVFGVAFALCLICLNFLAPKGKKPAPEAQNPA